MNETLTTDPYTLALGTLMSNLHAVELLLRIFLYHYGHKGKTSGYSLFDCKEGDEVACDEFTNYDSLDKLIKKYNKICEEKTEHAVYKVNEEKIIRLRDGIAHGRILSLSEAGGETLFKFSQPFGKEKQQVKLITKIKLDGDFFKENIPYLLNEIKKIQQLSEIEAPAKIELLWVKSLYPVRT